MRHIWMDEGQSYRIPIQDGQRQQYRHISMAQPQMAKREQPYYWAQRAKRQASELERAQREADCFTNDLQIQALRRAKPWGSGI